MQPIRQASVRKTTILNLHYFCFCFCFCLLSFHLLFFSISFFAFPRQQAYLKWFSSSHDYFINERKYFFSFFCGSKTAKCLRLLVMCLRCEKCKIAGKTILDNSHNFPSYLFWFLLQIKVLLLSDRKSVALLFSHSSIFRTFFLRGLAFIEILFETKYRTQFKDCIKIKNPI